jgi:hypothetical protein
MEAEGAEMEPAVPASRAAVRWAPASSRRVRAHPCVHFVSHVPHGGVAAYLNIVEGVPLHCYGCVAAGAVFCLEEQLVSPEVRKSSQLPILLPGYA